MVNYGRHFSSKVCQEPNEVVVGLGRKPYSYAGAGRQEGMEEEARGAGEMGEAGQEEVEVGTSQDGPVAWLEIPLHPRITKSRYFE